MPESDAMLRTLVIGIGSHHGDDRLGWLAAELIGMRDLPNVEVRLLATPGRLLNISGPWDHWLVMDACRGDDPPGTIHAFAWPDERLADTHFTGTHDLALGEALRLAETLELLPPRVTIIAGQVSTDRPGLEVTRATHALAERISSYVAEQLAASDSCPEPRHA